jgi:AraC-like DNA-binding protein
VVQGFNVEVHGDVGDEFTFGMSPGVQSSDTDEAADLLKHFYLPAEVQQADDAELDMRIHAARFPNWTAGRVHFASDVLLRAPDVTDYHVTIPLSGRSMNRWADGHQYTTGVGSAAVFSPGTPAAINWSAGCGQVCIKVSQREMQRNLEALLNRPVSEPVKFARRLDLTTPAARSWFELLRIIDREVGRPDGVLAHRLAIENMWQLLVQGFLLVHLHNFTEELTESESSAGPEVLRRAIELMHASPERAWSSTQLARETGVSCRALQKAFERAGHPPPMTYLRRLRLQRVRAELTSGSPTVTVTTAAGRWGFVHLGRFASQYRQLFGESPSETLRQGQR